MRRYIPKPTSSPCRAAWLRARRAITSLLVLLALSSLLSSCVDTRAEITFSRDGSGRMKLGYGLSRMVKALVDYPGSDDLMLLPLSSAEIAARATAAQGVTIVSFASKEGTDAITADLELTFTSPAALVRFLDPAGKRFHYTGGATGQSISATLYAGLGPAGAARELAGFYDAAFAPYSLNIAISFPVAVKVPGIGRLSADGRSLSYNIGLPALLSSPDPVVWEFRW